MATPREQIPSSASAIVWSEWWANAGESRTHNRPPRELFEHRLLQKAFRRPAATCLKPKMEQLALLLEISSPFAHGMRISRRECSQMGCLASLISAACTRCSPVNCTDNPAGPAPGTLASALPTSIACVLPLQGTARYAATSGPPPTECARTALLLYRAARVPPTRACRPGP